MHPALHPHSCGCPLLPNINIPSSKLLAALSAPPICISSCLQWTFWAAFGTSLGLVLMLSCSEKARRQHPLNLICLFAFTACEAVLVGTISSMYNTDIVLIAALLTVGITLCLSLYALQTKRDFTAAGGIMFSLLFALIGAGILSIFFRNRVMDIVVSGVGAALFGCYIVFDVQLMVGSGSYSISPDEYVLAAINIYLVSNMLGCHVMLSIFRFSNFQIIGG
jgi:FtsH-binding integral membrane protein